MKTRSKEGSTRFLGAIITLVATPVVLAWKLWAAVWRGELSRAWDGTGHSAIAQIYDQTIFPNTFGWTDAYLGGMPFPNFYPPLFYWCVALLHHTHLFSLISAFKVVVVLPALLMPAAIWLLAWFLSDRNKIVATAAALASVLLLVDLRIMGTLLAGLDYFSTFQIGLYTQPLGFVLMIAWYVLYSGIPLKERKLTACATSALLLALTVLSNFFSAITAAVFIVAILANDLTHIWRAGDIKQRREESKTLLLHLLSPLIALSLCLFWLVPMVTEYKYFVTRPYVVEAQSLMSPRLALWFVIALIGSVLWWRESGTSSASKQEQAGGLRTQVARYLTACAILALAVIFAAVFAPSWFPLQTPRFLATLTFLLTVPVGFALTNGFLWLAKLLGEISLKNQSVSLKRTTFTLGTTAVIFLIIVLSAPDLSWAYAFYPKNQKTSIDDVLDFARQHRDGRYLVEVINPKVGSAWTEASFDARAINSYLGSQGNETISGVFHEASPNALFTLPVVNAFSNYPDSFGISSVLADDLDFAAQPLSEQIKRAQFLGVKYLVIRTLAMKERVSKEISSAIRHDIGWWAVFELPGAPTQKIQPLQFKPALVLSGFTVKARRRNEMSFIRLAEEQFADNWFDVLLARSPESKIDRLSELDNFGALIIDTYDYADETAAFERLRKFAQDHAVICLSADNALFRRIQNSRPDFPLLEIIDRQPETPGETVQDLKPTHHYNSSAIRQQWKIIRSALEKNKLATDAAPSDLTGRIDLNTITLTVGSSVKADPVPVLIASTFHPNWQRSDGRPTYAVTPFFTLTFVDHTTSIAYGRRWFDKVGLWVSAVTLVMLCGFLAAFRAFHSF